MSAAKSSAGAGSGLGGAVALDLHEGFSTPAPRLTRCDRWPKALRLHGSNGVLARGRCRSTRLCDYCAKLEAVEISEVLALDAMSGEAPEVYAVLTSARVSTDPAEWYRHREKVLKALKLRWPDVRYCCITEFTTGRASTSGGKRRPHFNLLLKGIPAAEAVEASALIERVWCERLGADAEPWAQYAAPVAHEGGLLRYLALHFLKESQRPPKWWKGHRVTMSRGRNGKGGYLSQPTWKARAEAKAALRLKRAIYAAELAGHEPDEALAVAELEVIRAEQVRWSLVTLEVSDEGELTGIVPTMGGGMPKPARGWRRPDGRLTLDEENELVALRVGEPAETSCKRPESELQLHLQTDNARGIAPHA